MISMRTLALTMLLLLPATALALPLPGAAWVVTSDTTIEGLPLAIASDIIVMPGATLALKGVDALVATPANVTIRAGGALELVDGADAVTGAKRATSVAGAALSFVIYVEPGAALRVVNATLVGAKLALAGNARIHESAIASGILDVLAGSTDVNDTTLDAASGPAALVRAAGTLRLANVTVGQTGDYGVRVEQGVAVIENTTFSLSPEYALYGVGADLTVVDSTFSTHCGAFLVSGTSGRIERNTFTTINHGLSILSGGALDLRENLFRGTMEALLLFNSDPDVRENTFEENDVGVHVLPGATSEPTLRDNAFAQNSIGAQNDGASVLDAAYNWWGSAAGPAANDTSGSVMVAPWLVSPP